MALRSALVDRARLVSREATAQKVEGTTTYQQVTGPWFDCRLNLSNPDNETVEEGRVRVEQQPTLLYWRTAEDGTAVTLNADDELEIRANSLEFTPDGRWRVSAQPLVIRKKVVLLGAGYCNVQRVREP